MANPKIIAQAFASLAVFYPERIHLGLGTGEAINEVPSWVSRNKSWLDYLNNN
jgi:alkanesulfonate monooxygenase SsuD/methylene tetrahydromethanopterin reductase-like flavin-dependent oxidoreductase (luciferase family)